MGERNNGRPHVQSDIFSHRLSNPAPRGMRKVYGLPSLYEESECG